MTFDQASEIARQMQGDVWVFYRDNNGQYTTLRQGVTESSMKIVYYDEQFAKRSQHEEALVFLGTKEEQVRKAKRNRDMYANRKEEWLHFEKKRRDAVEISGEIIGLSIAVAGIWVILPAAAATVGIGGAALAAGAVPATGIGAVFLSVELLTTLLQVCNGMFRVVTRIFTEDLLWELDHSEEYGLYQELSFWVDLAGLISGLGRGVLNTRINLLSKELQSVCSSFSSFFNEFKMVLRRNLIGGINGRLKLTQIFEFRPDGKLTIKVVGNIVEGDIQIIQKFYKAIWEIKFYLSTSGKVFLSDMIECLKSLLYEIVPGNPFSLGLNKKWSSIELDKDVLLAWIQRLTNLSPGFGTSSGSLNSMLVDESSPHYLFK